VVRAARIPARYAVFHLGRRWVGNRTGKVGFFERKTENKLMQRSVVASIVIRSPIGIFETNSPRIEFHSGVSLTGANLPGQFLRGGSAEIIPKEVF
jgi:hypothetical protein